MVLYRQLTETEEADARAAERLVRVVNGLEVVLSAEEETTIRQEWAEGAFRQAKQTALNDVDVQLANRINAGFSCPGHTFACDGLVVADAKAIADDIQARNLQDNQTWPDKAGALVTMTANNFVTFARAIAAWNSGHNAVARGKKAMITACNGQGALDSYLNQYPINSGWPT